MTLNIEQAISLHASGRLAEAEKAYRDVLESEPSNTAVLKGLGIVLIQTQRFEEAYTCLTATHSLAPKDPDVLNNLGTAALQTGRLDEARYYLEQCIEIAPQHTLAHANLGVVLQKVGDFVASAAALEQALDLNSRNAETLFNYSQTLRSMGRLDAAADSAKRALNVAPNHLRSRVELATIQIARGQYKEAEISYRQALDVDGRAAYVHHNLGQLLLLSGQLEEGWAAFEWRWKTSDFQDNKHFNALPAWDGRALTEGKLLVWPEQGIGDEVLFAGMLGQLCERVPHIVLACAPRLVPVFTRSFPAAEVVDNTDLIEDGTKLSGAEAQIPLGNLGSLLRSTFESFPTHRGYLQTDPSRVSALKIQYESRFGNGLRIGLSWRSANPRSGEAKSMKLSGLAAELGSSQATFFDLQYGDTQAERDLLAKEAGGMVYRDPTIDPMVDLDAFAAQVAAMDLIITVSNTTAHIAGSLGVPCWVLLPAGDGLRWYWFLDRDDSPWYPSLRLFRQVTPGDWAPVVQKVKEALPGFLKAASGSS